MENTLRRDERDFIITPVEHWYEIHEGGVLVAKLFKTLHPTKPFVVFLQNDTELAKRVSTIGEAADFILQNSNPQKQ